MPLLQLKLKSHLRKALSLVLTASDEAAGAAAAASAKAAAAKAAWEAAEAEICCGGGKC